MNSYLSNLDLFSMNERIFYMMLIIIGILCSYFLVKPIISLLISVNSIRLLSYVISSCFIFLFFLIATLKVGEVIPKTYQLFKFVLQTLGVFGVCLLFVQLIRYIKSRLDI